MNDVEDEQVRITKGLPSWIPDWQTAAVPRPLIAWSGSYRASVEASLSSETMSISAGRLRIIGSLVAECISAASPFLPDILSVVDTSKTSAIGSFDLRELKANLGMIYVDGEPIERAIARTLVGDCLHTDRSLVVDRSFGESQWPGAYENPDGILELYHCYQTLLRKTADCVARGKVLEQSQALVSARPLGIEYYAAYRRTCKDRRFILMSTGHIGLGHSMVSPGDLIVLLAGGCTPYVLRKRGPKVDEYRFVGECYIHGLMNAEGMRDRDNGVFENPRWFEIV